MQLGCAEVRSSADLYSSCNATLWRCSYTVNHSQAFISEASGAGVFEEAHTAAWHDVHASAMHEACTQ